MMLRTTSWTAQQKTKVDNWVLTTADEIAKSINRHAPKIKILDQRPRQIYSEEQPDVFFPYVSQGMLEDLIAELSSRV